MFATSSALTLLKRQGITARIERVLAKSYDPITTQITQSVENWPVTAVIIADGQQRNNVVSAVRQAKMIIAAQDTKYAPRLQDSILYSGDRYKITRVNQIRKGETILMYQCDVLEDGAGENA
jgi:hypothetical protein